MGAQKTNNTNAEAGALNEATAEVKLAVEVYENSLARRFYAYVRESGYSFEECAKHFKIAPFFAKYLYKSAHRTQGAIPRYPTLKHIPAARFTRSGRAYERVQLLYLGAEDEDAKFAVDKANRVIKRLKLSTVLLARRSHRAVFLYCEMGWDLVNKAQLNKFLKKFRS